MEYKNSAMVSVIDDMIHSARDRKILKLRYIDGIKHEKIAETMDMSVRQIQNIIYRHEKALFAALEI